MVHPDAHLSEKVFADTIEYAATRDGFGTGVVETGSADTRVVVLCADLAESTRAEAFARAFPERFVEIGVAEQNMAVVAAGMAAAGKIPFMVSYAVFSPGRNYEHIRTAVALNRANVKICGMHAGVSVGADGASHQMLEDIGMMRMLPGMTIIAPMDREEAHKAVIAAAHFDGPVYLRFGRAPTPVCTAAKTPFAIGKALTLWDAEQPHCAIISTGSLSCAALAAAHALAGEQEVIVLHVPTVKPLDGEAILAVARRAGRVVTVEEHQVAGGFGSAVAELLAEQYPVPMRMVGVRDQFGQSGTPEELLTYYKLDALSIAEAVLSLMNAS